MRFLASTLALALGMTAAAAIFYSAAEPALSFGYTASTTSQFTISQTVTPEIAFKTAPADLVMSPGLNGVSGGTSNASAQLVVSTNNPSGYTMTLSADSSLGMVGAASSTSYIAAYVPTGTTSPDYSFAVNSPRGTAFGYTIAASTTADAAQEFLNNGAYCYAGATGNSGTGASHCWLDASTTPVTVVATAGPTPASGSTSTILFEVTIDPNPSPIVPNDTYIATTTLTASANP